jgi:hypothetical protein
MPSFWVAVTAVVGVAGTVLGVVITQRSERSRQEDGIRQREAEWSRDRRLDAYAGMVRSVSLRVSALRGYRENLEKEGFETAKWFADSATAEMWVAVRRVRLVGPESVADLAKKLSSHYSKIDQDGFPDRGGSAIEEQFGHAARVAIELPDTRVAPK